MKTLVDTNVLVDIITRDTKWYAWADAAIRQAAEHSTLAINPIVFAEVGVKFARIEDVDAVLIDFIARTALPYEAGFPRWKGLSRVQKARRHAQLANARFPTSGLTQSWAGCTLLTRGAT